MKPSTDCKYSQTRLNALLTDHQREMCKETWKEWALSSTNLEGAKAEINKFEREKLGGVTFKDKYDEYLKIVQRNVEHIDTLLL